MRRLRDRLGQIRVLHRLPHNKPQRQKLKKLLMQLLPVKAAAEDLRLPEVGSQALASLENQVLTYLISFNTTTSGKCQYIFKTLLFREQQ
jgi:hypothetical protein